MEKKLSVLNLTDELAQKCGIGVLAAEGFLRSFFDVVAEGVFVHVARGHIDALDVGVFFRGRSEAGTAFKFLLVHGVRVLFLT